MWRTIRHHRVRNQSDVRLPEMKDKSRIEEEFSLGAFLTQIQTDRTASPSTSSLEVLERRTATLPLPATPALQRAAAAPAPRIRSRSSGPAASRRGGPRRGYRGREDLPPVRPFP